MSSIIGIGGGDGHRRRSSAQITDDVLSGLPAIVAATAFLHRLDGCLDAAMMVALQAFLN
ncbi:MAG: hypothetical protein IPP19_01155 [Verrucomicrobia bacterium]|nr:hypothetical protein [Verrucomicrobiota bacterium]